MARVDVAEPTLEAPTDALVRPSRSSGGDADPPTHRGRPLTAGPPHRSPPRVTRVRIGGSRRQGGGPPSGQGRW